jgi:serine protease Do
VTPGTPAAEAGLKAGDVITRLNGQPVKDAGDLTVRIGSLKPGNKVELSYLRDGADKTASVTLASQNDEKAAKADAGQTNRAPLLGVQLAPAKEVSGAGDKGVVIVNVDPDGAAASKGLAEGDVILEVAGKPVASPEQVKSEIAAATQDGKKSVLMRVQTAVGDRFVAFAFPKA